ncbi:hypothetical protein [Viridibacillus arvi]|uniref:hypothetical protein n=1 Tax=Viridibacillus arvi TaxID=263475 RepID=UPI0034CFBCAC
MKTALLHGEIIDIEDKRISLESNYINRDDVIKKLKDEYRTFSRKGAFKCYCCDTPVKMNLTSNERSPFYFSHVDSRECSYSVNYSVYRSQQVLVEDGLNKQVGLAVLKEILEGQVKPLNIDVQRGYMFKDKLSFVPDFVLQFPNSKKILAVDYHTNIRLGKNGSFEKQLENRKRTYLEMGFQVFSFVDASWLALSKETGKGTLLNTESNFIMKNKHDHLWDDFIKTLDNRLTNTIRNLNGTDLLSIDTKSIHYLDINKRECKIVRFLQSKQHEKNSTIFSLVPPITIPLSKALTLNEDQTEFQLFHENEENLFVDFKKSILKHMKMKEERNLILNNIKPINIILEDVVQKKNEIHSKWNAEHYEKENISSELEEDEQRSDYRKEMANLRPVGFSEPEWRHHQMQVKKYGKKYEMEYGINQVPKTSQTDSMDKDRSDRLIETLYIFSINGSQYINGESKHWKKYVFNWIEKERKSRDLIISLSKLLKDMKESEFTFNQNDKLIHIPIQNFIKYYEKEFKKEFKESINISYI